MSLFKNFCETLIKKIKHLPGFLVVPGFHPDGPGSTPGVGTPTLWASQVVPGVKNLPTNTGDIRDASSIPGLGRSPGGGNGNPLQYSYLENPMDRGAWQATVHGVSKSQT